MSNFIVVAYYTTGTGYEAEARKLVASLLRVGVAYHVEAVPNLGSWQKNTHHKAEFILGMLDLHAAQGDLRPVVAVDADAIFHAYPGLFDTLDCDAAFSYRNYAAHPSRARRAGRELLSGTIYFANNDAARAIIREWIAENKRNPAMWEQRNLQAVVGRLNGCYRLAELPATYCKIFDLMRLAGPAVIEHYQKSRVYRRQIDRPAKPLKGMLTTHGIC